MTAGRMIAIVFIFLGVSAAWAILGGTLTVRTDQADQELRGQVADLWGTEMHQSAPKMTLLKELNAEEIKASAPAHVPVTVSPASSQISVDLNLDMRRKGLIWYRTYGVTFDATYTVSNPDDNQRLLAVMFSLPTDRASYDDFHFEVDGKEASPGSEQPGVAVCRVHVGAGETATIKARYKSRGMDRWSYSLGENALEARDFNMVIATDFDRIDFPAQSLSPGTKTQSGSGWELTWQYDHLVSGLGMGVEMPEKLQPGPWASRLSFFAPVGLLFYIFVLVVVGIFSGRNLHPMHYFFISGGFFAFHILLAYTVDLIDMHLAFSICSVVSVLLVVSYLLRVAGARFALGIAAPAQLAFLVLFSYAFYYPGYTGLSITIASIVTLALMMHLTAKVDWTTKLGGPPTAQPVSPDLPTGEPPV